MALLCTTPTSSYRSSDWFRSQKGRVCHQRQSRNRLQWRQSDILLMIVRGALRLRTHRCVCFGNVRDFPSVQTSGTREYTARFLTRCLTAARWHAVILRCCGMCVLYIIRVCQCCFYVRVTPTQRGSASLRRRSTETHADTAMRDWVCQGHIWT